MLIPSVETTTAAYFAGLFDGEGWIRVETRKGRLGGTAQLSIGLGSTDLSIAPKMKELFGGHLCRVRIPGKSSRKLMQTWGCTNDTAASFLKIIYPYMIIKKRQAALAFKFRNIMKQTGHKHSLHRYDLFLTLAAEIRSYNHSNGEVPHVQTVKTEPPAPPLIAAMSQSDDPE
jgi:hypothetical protein